jgi:hypothetical protein
VYNVCEQVLLSGQKKYGKKTKEAII